MTTKFQKSQRHKYDKLPPDEMAHPRLPPLARLPPLDFHPGDDNQPLENVDGLEKPTLNATSYESSFDNPLFTDKDLNGDQPKTLPAKTTNPFHRRMRFHFFTVYRRIFTLIIFINLIGIILLVRNTNFRDLDPDRLATWASSNFLVAILIRQDWVVSLMFSTVWLVPWSVPLWIRRLVARVYTYGGIHTGAAVAGTVWFILFTMVITVKFIGAESYALPTLILTWAILATLLTICLLAFPCIRARHHNVFELTHRLLGWLTVALFWAQLLFLVKQKTSAPRSSGGYAKVLSQSPTFYNLSVITAMLIYPWLLLRKWSFQPELLSSHAVRLHFTNRVRKFSCLNISSTPLQEWHPFATFPTRTTQASSSTDVEAQNNNTSLIVSAAGDWTKALIARCAASPTAPIKFYTKGIPHPGVLSLSVLFSRVVILTTGSGIGPTLASLLDRPTGQFIRLIWSTRSPLATYGAELLEAVHEQDPEAVVIDTDTMGRPDLTRVAYNVYKETKAEAVFVLSNKNVTKKVVYGLESRGVPAFGPIFDS